MILRNQASMRRLLASRLKNLQSPRAYHASAKLSADALDMVDTFARRHSEFPVLQSFFADVMLTSG
jgi:hypothetical protein